MICATCGLPAVRREVDVRHSNGGRPVVYETHAVSISDPAHQAALQRIDEFHERVHELQFSLRGQFQLTSGKLDQIEIGTVVPSACEIRTMIIPTATVRAFGITDEVTCEARPLGEATKEGMLEDLLTAGEVKAQALKARFERGDF